jgi:H+/Cl- antiporter ClcA
LDQRSASLHSGRKCYSFPCQILTFLQRFRTHSLRHHRSHLYNKNIFLLIRFLGGLLGCAFNFVNLKINSQRKLFYANHQWYHKVVEVFAVAVLTTFIQFAVPLFWGCDAIPESAPESMTEAFSSFGCPEGQYNEMATLLFNSQHSTIVTFFSRGSDLAEAVGLHTMAIFFILYFGLAVITAGLAVPSGLFFPFLILGGCSGRFVGKVVWNTITHFYAWTSIDPGVYAMIGTAGFITGSTRMTM